MGALSPSPSHKSGRGEQEKSDPPSPRSDTKSGLKSPLIQAALTPSPSPNLGSDSRFS
jgi:hypothetical protein